MSPIAWGGWAGAGRRPGSRPPRSCATIPVRPGDAAAPGKLHAQPAQADERPGRGPGNRDQRPEEACAGPRDIPGTACAAQSTRRKTAAKTPSTRRSVRPGSSGSRFRQRPRMNRWRTSPQRAMTAKPQQSSSHHSLAIHRRALQRAANRRAVRFFLGREVPASGHQAPGQELGHGADHDLLRAQRRPMPQRQLLGDLPLHEGIAADEHEGREAHDRRGRRGQIRLANLTAIAARRRPRPGPRPRAPGWPRGGPGSRCPPARPAARAGRQLPVRIAIAPQRRRAGSASRPRLSLSVSWPTSAGTGSRA